MNFGNKIRKLRLKKHMSQTSLAKELGVSTTAISQYETNKRFPDQKGIVSICRFFDVSADYLLGLSDMSQSLVSLSKLSENCNSFSDAQLAAISELLDTLKN